jgi:hypothetical protein
MQPEPKQAKAHPNGREIPENGGRRAGWLVWFFSPGGAVILVPAMPPAWLYCNFGLSLTNGEIKPK